MGLSQKHARLLVDGDARIHAAALTAFSSAMFNAELQEDRFAVGLAQSEKLPKAGCKFVPEKIPTIASVRP